MRALARAGVSHRRSPDRLGLRAAFAPHQARELVREEWAFPPDEEDVRRLPPERDPRTPVSQSRAIERQLPPVSTSPPPGQLGAGI